MNIELGNFAYVAFYDIYDIIAIDCMSDLKYLYRYNRLTWSDGSDESCRRVI